MNVSVEEAVTLIDSTIQLHSGDRSLPYFFIVGAGISTPEIPLSGGIIELCKKEISRRNPEYYSRCVEEMRQYEANDIKKYSGWIERAYPNSVDRSRFFKNIITKARISSANLMLAHILYSKKIATTVFTTNFDDKLKQALELIGVTDLFVAENVMDNLVITPQSENIQIIHVHGTYNFYDCANLEDEIQAVANQSNTISSSRVLENFLTNQAPIIVGYSGWENDVIMTCLKERLSYPTPFRYIWVCYSRESYDALPQWLKSSPRVDFVIPKIGDIGCGDEVGDSPFVQQTRRGKIDATTFFNLLISSIKLSIPEIFENPFSYYSKRIDKILPQHEDVLHLRHWAERMKCFGESNSPFEELVKQLEHADITNDIHSATSILQSITELSLPIADVRFTSETLIKGLLEKDLVLENFETKRRFRLAVLDYVEKNYDGLLQEGILNSCLHDIFFGGWRKEDSDAYIALLDRVYVLAAKDPSTLDVQLTAMGIKSTVISDREMRISLLNQIIELSSAHMDDSHIFYVHCVALYDLAELSPEAEAIKLIESADKAIHEDNRQRIHVKGMKSKARILGTLTDEELQIQWITELICSMETNMESLDPHDMLQISAYFSFLPVALLSRADRVFDFLSAIYDKCKNLDFSYCEHALWISEICITLGSLSADAAQKAFFYNNYKQFAGYIPMGCGSMETLRVHALQMYCMAPVSVVPDKLKAAEIQQFKQDYPNDHEAVISILLRASQVGNISAYKKFEDLQEEADYCEKYNMLSLAYTQYTSKDFKHAEELFTSLINCGYADIETHARNNLAFMVRRQETILVQDSFWDIIKNAPDDYIFKHMNIALYCIAKGLNDDPRYEVALSFLSAMTDEDAMSLYKCWADIDFVGKSESELALKLITETSKIELASLENKTM